jgi:hypothetical protein
MFGYNNRDFNTSTPPPHAFGVVLLLSEEEKVKH